MHRKTVLILEDDVLVRVDAVTLVQEAGYAPVDFCNADDAFEYVSQHSEEIAAIFTDVRMPGNLDGFAFAEIVGTRWPWIAMLLTTGYPTPVLGRLTNARFMPKPWRPLDLLALIQEAVEA